MGSNANSLASAPTAAQAEAAEFAADLSGRTRRICTPTVRELVFQLLGFLPGVVNNRLCWLDPVELTSMVTFMQRHSSAPEAAASLGEDLGQYILTVRSLMLSCDVVIAPLSCGSHHVMAAVLPLESKVVIADSLPGNCFFTPGQFMHALRFTQSSLRACERPCACCLLFSFATCPLLRCWRS